MSTATFTEPTPPAEPLTLPLDLWRAYRAERRMGSKQSVSVSAAFEAVGRFTKSDTRERLRDELIERETRDGLALTSREVEDEIAAEAEVGPVEPEPGSAAAIRRDAQRTVSDLEDRRRRLSPEALTDKATRAELTSIESEIVEARSLLDLVDTAQGEIDRRTREAVEAARRAAIERSEATAQALQPEIRRAAERIDTVAGTLAECVSAYAALKGQQAAAIAGTDRGQEAVRARSYRPAEVSSALFVALRERGVEIAGVDGTNRSKPLAVAEPEAL